MKISPRLKEELKKDLMKKIQEVENKVVVTSAYKLSQDEKSEIKRKFSLPVASYANEVDPEIIAGVIVQKGSRVIDLSLRTMLTNLQTQAS